MPKNTENTSPILMYIDGNVGVLRLNRPPRNTMTPELMQCFVDRLDEVSKRPEVRALVITSVGRHFCAGAELGATMPGDDSALSGVVGMADRLREVYRPFLALMDLPIPSVAAVNGAAVGGGLGLALSCDFRVVSAKSRMMAPFVRLGIHPGMGLTHLLPALIGVPRAMEMLLTGCEVHGEQALQWGMANRCVDEDVVEEEAILFAHVLAGGAPAVVRWTRRAVHRNALLDPGHAADMEALAQALTFQTDDMKEGMRAFFEKRSPNFSGS
jgi:enoyl-CoA hydratase/carnithine racemase